MTPFNEDYYFLQRRSFRRGFVPAVEFSSAAPGAPRPSLDLQVATTTRFAQPRVPADNQRLFPATLPDERDPFT